MTLIEAANLKCIDILARYKFLFSFHVFPLFSLVVQCAVLSVLEPSRKKKETEREFSASAGVRQAQTETTQNKRMLERWREKESEQRAAHEVQRMNE